MSLNLYLYTTLSHFDSRVTFPLNVLKSASLFYSTLSHCESGLTTPLKMSLVYLSCGLDLLHGDPGVHLGHGEDVELDLDGELFVVHVVAVGLAHSCRF